MPIDLPLLADHLSDRRSRLEVVLRGHLWVESVLNGLIEAKLRVPEALDIDRMSFASKVSLAHALGVIPAGDVGWFRKLGKLRNRLAHSLGGEPTDGELAELETSLSQDTQDMFGEVASDQRGAHKRLRSAFILMLLRMEWMRMMVTWRRENEDGIVLVGAQRALARLDGVEITSERLKSWRDAAGIPAPPRPRDALAAWPPGLDRNWLDPEGT